MSVVLTHKICSLIYDIHYNNIHLYEVILLTSNTLSSTLIAC